MAISEKVTQIFFIYWLSIINIDQLILITVVSISIVINYQFHRLDTTGISHTDPIITDYS